MPRYMDQLLFNSLVYTVAFADHIRPSIGTDADPIVEKMIASYRTAYPKDDFEVDLQKAKPLFLAWLYEHHGNGEAALVWLNAFRQASMDWLPSGKRQTRPLFNGTFFTALRKHPVDRASSFLSDTVLYYAHINTGQINSD